MPSDQWAEVVDCGVGDLCMALELYDGSLRGISGKFNEDEVFKIENEELEDFEKQFPCKEKHITDTQLKL
jgi:hypothetical protein